MQGDLRQLESAVADCESQRDLDAVDTVRHDAWSHHAGRGGPRPRAAARRKAKLCSEEGSHYFLQQISILARSEQPEPSAKASVARTPSVPSGMIAGVSVRDGEAQGHVQQPAGRQNYAVRTEVILPDDTNAE